MKISLDNIGKQYHPDWIFRHRNDCFEKGNAYAITGSNGSGKSTLLQIISGALTPTEGTITYLHNNKALSLETIYRYSSIVAPYIEVVEEMTAEEFLHFHASFKPFMNGLSIHAIIKTIGLEKAAKKQIRFYSNGMKQRIKLAQAIFSDTPILLLDEPCTNLDTEGYALYHQLLQQYAQDKIIIVSSNDVQEYEFCTQRILLS